MILIDGVRSNDEIEVLRKIGNVKLLPYTHQLIQDLVFTKEVDQMILRQKNILKKETIVN